MEIDPEPGLFWNGRRVTHEEFDELLVSAEEEELRAEDEIMQRVGVSRPTASAIIYLRSRSRWTVEKELELIERDRAGNPIPLSEVLSGIF